MLFEASRILVGGLIYSDKIPGFIFVERMSHWTMVSFLQNTDVNNVNEMFIIMQFLKKHFSIKLKRLSSDVVISYKPKVIHQCAVRLSKYKIFSSFWNEHDAQNIKKW